MRAGAKGRLEAEPGDARCRRRRPLPLWLRLCTCVVAALLATPSPPGLPLAVTASGQQQHEWLHGLLDARIAAADEVHRQFLEKGNWVARLEVVVRDVQQAAAAAAGAPAAGGGGGVDSRPPPELELSAVRQLVDDVRRLVDSTTGSKASALTNKQLAEVVGAIAAEVLRLPLHNQLSYSLTRRLVMSGLLAVHLHGRRLPPAVQTSVAAMCRKLLRLHQTSAEAKGALEFFHVSKAGGTSLCSLGGINGCRTQYFDPKHNCLVRYFGDAPRWTMRNVTSILPYDRYPWPANVGIKLYSVDCDDRLRYLRSHGWNFYANEYVMHRGGGGGSDGGGYRRAGPCPQFTYVTVLRHPLDRVVSHMNNIVKEYTRKYGPELHTHFDVRSTAHWAQLAPVSVNNYILRSLLGEAAFLLPLDALGLEHVQAARLVLLQLDNLMTLEDSALNDVIFAHGLGWRHTFGVAHARDGSNITHVTEDKLPPELLAFLRHRNELDVKLFHYAHLLQVLDGACFVIAAQAPAGAGGGGEAAAAASTAQPLPQQPSCGFAGLKEHHRRQHESSAPADADTN